MLTADFHEPDFKLSEGRLVRLELLDWSVHRQGLFDCLGGQENADIWDWMAVGPFSSAEQLEGDFSKACAELPIPWQTVVILNSATGVIMGMASYMRIRPSAGSVEVGCVSFSHALQRTAAATEAMYLMMAYAFDDLGYRRYEWKCNRDNAPSMRAAERLGFTFEGVFRQDLIVKGKNRDTAWFSILDSEWPAIKTRITNWLDPNNFDDSGKQLKRLSDL